MYSAQNTCRLAPPDGSLKSHFLSLLVSFSAFHCRHYKQPARECQEKSSCSFSQRRDDNLPMLPPLDHVSLLLMEHSVVRLELNWDLIVVSARSPGSTTLCSPSNNSAWTMSANTPASSSCVSSVISFSPNTRPCSFAGITALSEWKCSFY